MAHCTDTFSKGWQHSVWVLFSPFRAGYWLLMACLMFLCENLMHIDPTLFISQDVLLAAREDPSVLEPLLLKILILGVVYFFLMLIFLLISSGAKMVYLVGVRHGSVSVFKTLEDLLPRIITYYLWNVIVPIIGLVFIFIVTLIFAIAILLPLGITDPLSAGIAVMILMVFIGLCVFFVMFIYLVLMRSFVVPLMVFQDKGIFHAWGSTLGLIFSNFFESLGFFLIRFALLMGLILVMVLPVIGVTFLFDYIDNVILADHDLLRGMIGNINILLFAAIIEPFLLPYNILVDSYSLAFLRRLTGDNRFLPDTANANMNGNSTSLSEPHFTPPLAQSSPPQPPFSTINPASYMPISKEPVAFKDIPVETEQNVSPAQIENRVVDNNEENQNITKKGEQESDTPPPPPFTS